jgi:hypothetical protein
MYALNVESFPHMGDSIAYPSQWIFSRICKFLLDIMQAKFSPNPLQVGTTVAIAVPLVIIAFYVNNILDWYEKHVVKKYKKWKAGREREPEEKEQETPSWPTPSPPPTVKPFDVPQTKHADDGSKPAMMSQLISKLSGKKSTSGRRVSTSRTPSDIEAGKPPVIDEKPDE